MVEKPALNMLHNCSVVMKHNKRIEVNTIAYCHTCRIWNVFINVVTGTGLGDPA